MLVIEDFLEPRVFLALRSAFEAPSFPWEHSRILSAGFGEPDPGDNQQDVHGLYLQRRAAQYRSQQFALVTPVIDRLAPADLIKVKVNRTARKDRAIEYGLHVDTRRPGAATAILYLNTNNGYTLFEGGEKVHSVANRVVLFDAARRHTGASCTDAAWRLVLNINLMGPGGAGLRDYRT